MKTIWKYPLLSLVTGVIVISLGVLATSCTFQSVTPTIAASVVDKTIRLEATTPSEGTYYCLDSWDGATKLSTILDDGSYVSTAVFTPTKSETFTVTYRITMFGKSGTVWTGTASVELAVTIDSATGLPLKYDSGATIR